MEGDWEMGALENGCVESLPQWSRYLRTMAAKRMVPEETVLLEVVHGLMARLAFPEPLNEEIAHQPAVRPT